MQVLVQVISPFLVVQTSILKLLNIHGPKNPNNLLGGNKDFPNLEKTIFINLKAIELMSSDIKS